MAHSTIVQYFKENGPKYPAEKLRERLRQSGYSDVEIAEAEREVSGPQAPSPPVPQPPAVKQPKPRGESQDLESLVEKGVISKEQARAVAGAIKTTRKEKKHFFTAERFIRFLAIFGALLVGVGIILFFAANWKGISPFLKVVILIGSTLGAYTIGYLLRFRPGNYPPIGEAAFLIGSFLYGTSIFFILQTYHIQVEYPNEVLFWWLGILPLGYLLALRSIGALAHLLILFWFGYALIDAGTVSIVELIALYISLGALFVVLGRWYARIPLIKPQAVFLRGLGYVSLVVGIFPFTSIRFGGYILGSSSGYGNEESLFWIFYLAFLVVAGVLALVFFLKYFPRNIGLRLELFGAPALALIAAPFFTGGIEATAGIGIFFNLLLLAFLLGIIAIGYFERKHGFVNLGISLLGLDVIIRYFEFAGDLFQGAAFFIVGGLLLIGLAVALERVRREIIKRIDIPQS